MELYDQIRKISFIFFVILGLAHFLAGLAYINGYFVPQSGLANRVLFIPFVLSTLSFALSSLKYNLLEYGKNEKWMNYAIVAIGIIVFLGLLAIELFVVDSKTPLLPPV